MSFSVTALLTPGIFSIMATFHTSNVNVFGGSAGGPIVKDKTFIFGNYEGFRQILGLSDLTLVPDDTSRANAVASVRPLLALWPAANGQELLTSTGTPSGIAEAFSNPLQHLREDFGTARFDQHGFEQRLVCRRLYCGRQRSAFADQHSIQFRERLLA